jgi:hypothetical protein
MKIHLKFKHDADTVLESLDCPFTSDEVSDQVSLIIEKFISDDKYQEKSHLAEIIHNELDYSIILFIALRSFVEDLEKAAIKTALKRMLSDDDETI